RLDGGHAPRGRLPLREQDGVRIGDRHRLQREPPPLLSIPLDPTSQGGGHHRVPLSGRSRSRLHQAVRGRRRADRRDQGQGALRRRAPARGAVRGAQGSARAPARGEPAGQFRPLRGPAGASLHDGGQPGQQPGQPLLGRAPREPREGEGDGSLLVLGRGPKASEAQPDLPTHPLTGRRVEHGLYIHLPYCRSLCPYCAFAKAPLHHAELRATLDWVRASWDLKRVREWTVEANPEGLTAAKLALLRAAGVDRLSLGVQSLEPAVLRSLGRIHKPERALQAVADARRAGFTNVSVDLMVAVPGETEDGVIRAITAFVDLGVQHLSIYSLQVEAGTPLAGKVERGAVTPLDEDVAADRYERVGGHLAQAG